MEHAVHEKYRGFDLLRWRCDDQWSSRASIEFTGYLAMLLTKIHKQCSLSKSKASDKCNIATGRIDHVLGAVVATSRTESN